MMPDAGSELEDHEDMPPSGSYVRWRRVHLLASWIVVGTGLAHLGVGVMQMRDWSPDVVWFLGAGLGVLIAGALNLVHIGHAPCRMPTVRFVRAVNVMYTLFALAAVVAVPEAPAIVLTIAFGAQVLAGRVTMPGPG